MATPPTGNPVGRPTKYKPEFCEMLIEHVTMPEIEVIENMDKTQRLQFVVKPMAIPSLHGFCAKVGVHKGTIYDWAENNPEFAESLSCARDILADNITRAGTLGAINPTFAKAAATNLIGWSDKAQVTGANGGAIKVVVADDEGDL